MKIKEIYSAFLLHLNSNMELLIFKVKGKIPFQIKLFKFQYGATNICSQVKMMKEI